MDLLILYTFLICNKQQSHCCKGYCIDIKCISFSGLSSSKLNTSWWFCLETLNAKVTLEGTISQIELFQLSVKHKPCFVLFYSDGSWSEEFSLTRSSSCLLCMHWWPCGCYCTLGCSSSNLRFEPWLGTLLSLPLSTQVYTWLQVNLTLGAALRWTSTDLIQWEQEILLVASWYRNQI